MGHGEPPEPGDDRRTARGFPAAATRQEVVDLAVDDLVAGHDLDLRAVARRAGVGRSTRYRWFGGRSGLLGEALWTLTDRAWIHARRSATGSGSRYVEDVVATFLTSVATSTAASTLMSREPRLAVTSIMSPTGPVQRRAVARTAQLLQDHSDLAVDEVRAVAEVLTQIAMTYVWAQLLTGTQADLTTPLSITRRLLRETR